MDATTARARCASGSQRAYHVDWDKAHYRWDVIDDEGRHIGYCHNLGDATELAIREAQHDHGSGHDVIVCVQDQDGHYQLAWSSR